MKTIYKYPIEFLSEQTIEVPQGSEILTIQNQYEKPCIWAAVDTDRTKAPLLKMFIKMVSTGEVIDALPETYLGTCQFSNGAIVFHFFIS